MKQKIFKALQYHFHHPNYAFFLGSLFLMLILPPIAALYSDLTIVMEITFGLVVFMSCLYTATNYKDLIIMSLLGLFLFLLFLRYAEGGQVSILNPIVTFVFFTLVFTRIIRYVFRERAITANDLFALASGYLILGVLATPFFYFLHINFPGSFQIAAEDEFYELLYFSFITLTAVGYGDITPLHPLAKSFSLLLGIIGQLYLAVLVGIIIGKYLASNK